MSCIWWEGRRASQAAFASISRASFSDRFGDFSDRLTKWRAGLTEDNLLRLHN
jgi:hypothetical protein